MNLLLDTHVLAWWLTDKARLPSLVVDRIVAQDTEVFVSIVNAWEIAIKVGRSKWLEATPILDSFEAEIATEGFRLLPITVPHVRLAGLMTSPHRDPFDRLLAAQAQVERLTLVTADPKVQALGANWMW